MDAVDSFIQARMRQLLETDEDREEAAAGRARASAAYARAIADQVREYRGYIARMEAEPDGAARNASAIRFHQTWIDENTPLEDKAKLPAVERGPDHRPDAG